MPNRDRNTGTTTNNSKSYLMGCERCGGTGFVIERMLMSTFWERYRTDVGHYLYGNRDWEDDFAVPCPKCAGGLERKSMLIKKFAGFPSALYDKLKSFLQHHSSKAFFGAQPSLKG